MHHHSTHPEHTRDIYIDYLRGFMFLYMAIDHSLHGYAEKLGRYWFIQDDVRTPLFDAFYLNDNSIIIPALFFCIGFGVIPALRRYGVWTYLKNRVIKYALPFIICVPTVVALLTYPKYKVNEDSGTNFLSYWQDIFFSEKLQAGPLWVVFALLLYTVITVFFYKYHRAFCLKLQSLLNYVMTHRVKGILIFTAFSALILGVTDLYFGAPYWFGFSKVFYFQGSRFLQQALFFFMGAALGSMDKGLVHSFMESLSRQWLTILGITVLLGAAYIGFTLHYFDHTYDNALLIYFYQGEGWPNFWSALEQVAPYRLTRTTLHGIFALFQLLTLLSLFYRFLNHKSCIWTSLALNGYGIFLIHEMIVVWMQYGLRDYTWPIGIKFALVAGVGITTAWIASDILRRIPAIRCVLGTGVKNISMSKH